MMRDLEQLQFSFCEGAPRACGENTPQSDPAAAGTVQGPGLPDYSDASSL